LRFENRILYLSFIVAILLTPSFLALAKPDEVILTIIELRANGKTAGGGNIIPPSDNSLDDSHYSLLRYHWYKTAEYYVNTANDYSYSSSQLEGVITSSANTWDDTSSVQIFTYLGTTDAKAGVRDDKNVVSFGSYTKGVIGVTYLWSSRGQMLETDTILNTYYGWSLSGESGKMDVQNIMTHEFGHWCGLGDLYKNSDYWLTMYGYSDYGFISARTLGLGDKKGIIAIYGL
jgi:M6 family metalloprotease-like protein